MTDSFKTHFNTVTVTLGLILLAAVAIAVVVIVVKKNTRLNNGSLISTYNRIFKEIDGIVLKMGPVKGTRGVPVLYLLQLSPKGRIIEIFPVYRIPKEGVTISRNNATKTCSTDIVLKRTHAASTVSKDAVAICKDSEGIFLQRVASLNRITVFENGRFIDIGDKAYSVPNNIDKLLFCIGNQWLMLQPASDGVDEDVAGQILGRTGANSLPSAGPASCKPSAPPPPPPPPVSF